MIPSLRLQYVVVTKQRQQCIAHIGVIKYGSVLHACKVL